MTAQQERIVKDMESQYLHFERNDNADEYCNLDSESVNDDEFSSESMADIELETMMAIEAEKSSVKSHMDKINEFRKEYENRNPLSLEVSDDSCVVYYANDSGDLSGQLIAADPLPCSLCSLCHRVKNSSDCCISFDAISSDKLILPEEFRNGCVMTAIQKSQNEFELSDHMSIDPEPPIDQLIATEPLPCSLCPLCNRVKNSSDCCISLDTFSSDIISSDKLILSEESRNGCVLTAIQKSQNEFELSNMLIDPEPKFIDLTSIEEHDPKAITDCGSFGEITNETSFHGFDGTEDRTEVIKSLKSLIYANDEDCNIQSVAVPKCELTSVATFTFQKRVNENDTHECKPSNVDNVFNAKNVELAQHIFPQCHQEYQNITLESCTSLPVTLPVTPLPSDLLDESLKDHLLGPITPHPSDPLDNKKVVKNVEKNKKKLTPTEVSKLFKNFTKYREEETGEEADNNSPGWDKVRLLETLQEKFNYVQQQWQNSTVPDPQRNLTEVRSWTSLNNQRPLYLPAFVDEIYTPFNKPSTTTSDEHQNDYSVDINIEDPSSSGANCRTQPGRGIKRLLDCTPFHPAKRAKMVPFTAVYEHILDKVRGNLNEHIDDLERKEIDASMNLKEKHMREYSSLRKRFRWQPAFECHRQPMMVNMYHNHTQNLVSLQQHFDQQRQELYRQLDPENLRITESVNHMISLQSLYNDANEWRGQTNFMANEEVNEVVESLNYYSLFNHYYN